MTASSGIDRCPGTRRPDALRRVVVVHGYQAGPQKHWFPWLRRVLAERGIATEVVELPNPRQPVADEWAAAVRRTLGEPDPSTWVIGHSLGCITALRVLSGLTGEWSLGGLVLVAGFGGPLPGLRELDPHVAEPVEPATIIANVPERAVVYSDDDPIVPPRLTQELGDHLRARQVEVPAAGHFLDREGVTELPVLVRLLESAVR